VSTVGLRVLQQQHAQTDRSPSCRVTGSPAGAGAMFTRSIVHTTTAAVVLGHSHKTPRAWSQMLVGYTTHSVSIRGHAATSYYRRAGGFTVLHRAALRGTCKHVITSVRLIVTQETQLSRRGRSRPMSLEILLK